MVASGWEMRTSVLITQGSSMTISNAQVMAPVEQTASQRVHQSHTVALTIETTLSSMVNDSERHTVTHNPHPLHFPVSMTGSSFNCSPLLHHYNIVIQNNL